MLYILVLLFCTDCGTELLPETKFCPKCGKHIIDPVSTLIEHSSSEKKKWSKKKKIGVGTIFFFMIMIFLGAISGSSPNKDQASIEIPELSPAEIKVQALSGITYDDLMRNNENYVGQIVHYTGKVLQVQKIDGDSYVMRIAVTEKSFYYDDAIYVNYAGSRILEDDIVEFWGKVVGLKEYAAILGNSVTIPEVDALIVKVVKKQG